MSAGLWQGMHLHRPRRGGSQCLLCWGWADDPRHAGLHPDPYPAGPAPVTGPYAMRRRGTRRRQAELNS